nr:hypothetical protein Q903MT_gene1384 [Picea sitchensis]
MWVDSSLRGRNIGDDLACLTFPSFRYAQVFFGEEIEGYPFARISLPLISMNLFPGSLSRRKRSRSPKQFLHFGHRLCLIQPTFSSLPGKEREGVTSIVSQ